MGFLKSQLGVTSVLILICLVILIVVIMWIAKEEPLTVGTRDQVNDARSAALQPESRDLRRTTDKED
ncbi:protein disulfide isomerase [Dorcoceras hygrometricum]|uniref:Protein disulfide isomerase n=1 Tax=Dorcoceras hygrometricum TaxID=472368 RepID=A0A2Z7C7F5_9LAMI|nr:protein disulfide isomerase [Dorcoceras hygrometricum]